MAEKLKIGIIGTGGISHEHMRGYTYLAEQGKVEVTCACDIDAEKLAEYCKQYNIPRMYTDFNEMLDKEELDGVSVTTWNEAHCAPTIAALDHGVNVICEKPMAMNAEEAQRMLDASKRNNKVLQIGFVRRFDGDSMTFRPLVEQGVFGDVYYARAKYMRECGCPGSWFQDKKYSGGGPLIDLGVHAMDQARYIAGCPKPIKAYGITYDNLPKFRGSWKSPWKATTPDGGEFEYTVEDLAAAYIHFDNGFTLHIETSFNINSRFEKNSVHIFGTKAGTDLTCVYGINDGKVTDYVPEFVGHPYGDGFIHEIVHFTECITDGIPCRAPAEDGLALMKMIDAIYESARTGQAVDID